ncbi:hypothetical protein CRENBAI_014136, partial [Crenichthys baileyi]
MDGAPSRFLRGLPPWALQGHAWADTPWAREEDDEDEGGRRKRGRVDKKKKKRREENRGNKILQGMEKDQHGSRRPGVAGKEREGCVTG